MVSFGARHCLAPTRVKFVPTITNQCPIAAFSQQKSREHSRAPTRNIWVRNYTKINTLGDDSEDVD
jgi:hypothetical protein